MALELKDFQEIFNTKAETKEEFLKEFEGKYHTEEQIFKDEAVKQKILGRTYGTLTTQIAKIFRKSGIELTGTDLENPVEKVLETGVSRMADNFATQKVEFEKTAGLSVDERIKSIEEAKTVWQNKAKELEGLVATKASEFESLLNTKENEVKAIRLGTIKSETERSINFLPDIDPYKKKGWLSDMNDRYKIETEEDGSPFIVSAKDNTRIKSTQHAGTFMTPSEVYQMEAAKAGVMSINPKAGKPATAIGTVQADPQKKIAVPGRIVAPAAIVS